MYHITVYTIGKIKEPWLAQALEEYTKRLSPYLQLKWSLAKDIQKLLYALEPVKKFICLDSNGKSFSSEQFSQFLIKEWTLQNGHLSFVIGGATGLPAELIKRASSLVSLSPMTFTHLWTRVTLIEQIYRGIAIANRLPYHK